MTETEKGYCKFLLDRYYAIALLFRFLCVWWSPLVSDRSEADNNDIHDRLSLSCLPFIPLQYLCLPIRVL